jgi:hypothetical protein
MTGEPDKAKPDKPDKDKPEPRRPGGKTKRGLVLVNPMLKVEAPPKPKPKPGVSNDSWEVGKSELFAAFAFYSQTKMRLRWLFEREKRKQ